MVVAWTVPSQQVEHVAGKAAGTTVRGTPPKIVKFVKATGILKELDKITVYNPVQEHKLLKVIDDVVITKVPVGVQEPPLMLKLYGKAVHPGLKFNVTIASQLPGQLGGVTEDVMVHCDFIKPADKINNTSRNCFIGLGLRVYIILILRLIFLCKYSLIYSLCFQFAYRLRYFPHPTK